MGIYKEFKWGDEIESMILQMSPEEKKARLALVANDLLINIDKQKEDLKKKFPSSEQKKDHQRSGSWFEPDIGMTPMAELRKMQDNNSSTSTTTTTTTTDTTTTTTTDPTTTATSAPPSRGCSVLSVQNFFSSFFTTTSDTTTTDTTTTDTTTTTTPDIIITTTTDTTNDDPWYVFVPEACNYQIETTPGVPYGSSLRDFSGVESNMNRRTEIINELLGKDQINLMFSVYPILGCGDFLSPTAGDDTMSFSKFIPDRILSIHPRYKSIITNVSYFTGREGYVPIKIPLYQDEKTKQ